MPLLLLLWMWARRVETTTLAMALAKLEELSTTLIWSDVMEETYRNKSLQVERWEENMFACKHLEVLEGAAKVKFPGLNNTDLLPIISNGADFAVHGKITINDGPLLTLCVKVSFLYKRAQLVSLVTTEANRTSTLVILIAFVLS